MIVAFRRGKASSPEGSGRASTCTCIACSTGRAVSASDVCEWLDVCAKWASHQLQQRLTMLALYYGRSHEPLVHIAPDGVYPNMWRIHWPDGRISDMVNLTRAKDAARLICQRDMPGC